MRIARHVLVFTVLVIGAGCESTPSAPQSAPLAASQSGIYEDKTNGIRFNYPKDWTSQKGATSIFKVSKGTSSLNLDVPVLPAIAKFGLPIDKVTSGYIDDLKKNRIKDATVDENADVSIPDAKAKRVKLSGHENGKPSIDVAVNIVHDGKLYILSCDSDDAGYAAARKALDDAVGSIQWIK